MRERLAEAWRRERPALPLWLPVMIGCGVWLYFASPAEPPVWVVGFAGAGPPLAWAAMRRRMAGAALAFAAAAALGIGFAAAGARARLVAAPVIAAPMQAALEGRVRAVSRSRGGRPRLTLDEVVVFGLPPAATPDRVRATLLSEAHLAGVAPGARISVMAGIGPPPGPSAPGGFDFRRLAWFEGLGAIAVARGPPAILPAGASPGVVDAAALALARARLAMARDLRARLPGETGAIAAALIVGDRTAIPAETAQALRDSSLAHLLAISGLHMGLLSGLAFGGLRLAIALIPGWGARLRGKRVAAMGALAAAAAYLALSGASVATQRAFVMVAVFLAAAMIDRPAVTLRALAAAATLLLLLRPESLMEVGFQMSFAATAAIVAGFEALKRRRPEAAARGWRRRLAAYAVGLVCASALAGAATAPFAAYHFNRVASYGLLANLAAMPAMAFWVAPSAALAGALAPLGLEGIALQAMGRGVSAILWIARKVAGFEGAVRLIPAAPGHVLGLIAAGGLGLCLGRAWLRAGGAAVVALGFALWALGAARPEALIGPGGRIAGVATPAGLALDAERAAGYTAAQWLRRAGDDASQAQAAAREGFAPGYAGGVARLPNGWTLATVHARRPDPDMLARLCRPRTLLIARRAAARPEGACRFLGRRRLAESGALAIWTDGPGLRLVGARRAAGDRFWTRGPDQ